MFSREKRSRLARVQDVLSQIHPTSDHDFGGTASASQRSVHESDDSCGGSDGDEESEGESVTPLVTNSRQKRYSKTLKNTTPESTGTARGAIDGTTPTSAPPRTSIVETPRSRHVPESLSPSPVSDGGVAGMEVATALKEITSLLNTVVKRIDKVENEIRLQLPLPVLVNLKAVQPRRKHRFQQWLRYANWASINLVSLPFQ